MKRFASIVIPAGRAGVMRHERTALIASDQDDLATISPGEVDDVTNKGKRCCF